MMYPGSNRHALDNVGVMSVLASVGIFATTIQAQDFKDTDGDRLVGRKTLPIVAPYTARPTLMLALMLWSVGLSSLWGLSISAALAFNTASLFGRAGLPCRRVPCMRAVHEGRV